MMPHEAQATMAKILFFVFATFVLCLGKTRAASIESHAFEQLTNSSSVRTIVKISTYHV
jgi:hypothetical protein